MYNDLVDLIKDLNRKEVIGICNLFNILLNKKDLLKYASEDEDIATYLLYNYSTKKNPLRRAI